MTIDSRAITPLVISTPTLSTASYDSHSFSVFYEGLIDDDAFGCLFDIKITNASGTVITETTLKGEGHGNPERGAGDVYKGTSRIRFYQNYYYGTLPTASSGMKVYIRYNPKHDDEYLKDISGKELKTPSEWVEVTIQ